HGVNVHFTAPTAMRGVRKEDPDGELMKKCDLSSLRAECLAGERLDPGALEWRKQPLAEATGRGVPVVDNGWQPATGRPIAARPRGLTSSPLTPGSPTDPVPGYQVESLDPNGTPVPAGKEGLIVMRLPLPPGTMATVWGDDSRFI